MHSRNPRSFGPAQVRAALFRVTDAGGLAMNLPVSAELPGQLSAISSAGGVRLALGTGSGDTLLEATPDGGIAILLGILSYYFRPDGASQYLRPGGVDTYIRP